MVAKQSVCDYFSILGFLALWWMAPKLCTFSFSKANNGKLIKPNLTVCVFILLLICQSDCVVHPVCRFTTKSISAILLTVWSQPSNHLLTNAQRQQKTPNMIKWCIPCFNSCGYWYLWCILFCCCGRVYTCSHWGVFILKFDLMFKVDYLRALLLSQINVSLYNFITDSGWFSCVTVLVNHNGALFHIVACIVLQTRIVCTFTCSCLMLTTTSPYIMLISSLTK